MGRTSSSLKWMAMPLARGQQHLVLARGEHGLDEGVVVLHGEGDDAAGARVGEGGELRLLHDALAGGEQHVAAGLELADAADRPAIFSPGLQAARGSPTALPLPCGPTSGISWTFSQ